GGERKIARLRYLRDRWAKRLLAFSPRVRVLTPLDSPHTGAIGLISVEGLEPRKLTPRLMEKHRIVTVAINHKEFSGLRITPNVYTTVEEVDRFADMIERAITQGIE